MLQSGVARPTEKFSMLNLRGKNKFYLAALGFSSFEWEIIFDLFVWLV